MSEIGLRPRMLVKDVMSSPATTVNDEATVGEVAKSMDTWKRGSIIVTNKEGRPLGIITERDLVTRVLAKNKLASELKAGEVMTTPLVTTDPDETLSNAARQMGRLKIQRLGVVYKGDLAGLVSGRDILAVMPELLEIMQEENRIESEIEEKVVEKPLMAGYCDRCRQWSNRLKEVEGEFLCEDCRIENEE